MGDRLTVEGGARPKAPSDVAYSGAVGACEALANVIGGLEERLRPVLLEHGPPTPVMEPKEAPAASPLEAHFRELTERVTGSRITIERLIERLDC